MAGDDSTDRSASAPPTKPSNPPDAGAASASPSTDDPALSPEAVLLPLLIVRSVIGGLLMGLANLVPGISGGTMLLASGVYPYFINGIAEVTTLKFRVRSLIVLGVVIASAVVAIGLFAGVVKSLVIDHRWVMYSLFIGLTLGGVPIVWKLIGKPTAPTWYGASTGLIAMIAIAIVQMNDESTAGGSRDGFVMLLIAGVAGASAMILPGVSGGYLLLVLGAYLPILAGIDDFTSALKAGDIATAMNEPFRTVILPVGIGVVGGVVVVSNLIRFLLRKYEQATLGFLLGLLIGAVAGLWPFHADVPLAEVTTVKRQAVEVQNEQLVFKADGEPVDREDYPTVLRKPTAGEAAGAGALMLVGFGVTFVIARIGGDDDAGKENATPDEKEHV